MAKVEFPLVVLRPVEAKGRKGWFHTWEHRREIVLPGILKGSSEGGAVSCVMAVVEYEDGTVGRGYPEDMRFLDREKEEDRGRETAL